MSKREYDGHAIDEGSDAGSREKAPVLEIPASVIEAAMKGEHEAERAALIAEGEEAPEPWDDIQDEWGDGTESWSHEQALSFARASLVAALVEWGATEERRGKMFPAKREGIIEHRDTEHRIVTAWQPIGAA